MGLEANGNPVTAEAHFNGLSPEVAELLAVLAEECAEVIQEVGKVLRHGIRVNPYSKEDIENGTLNVAHLSQEVSDVYTIVGALCELGLLNDAEIKRGIKGKISRLCIPGILHHSSLFK